jgi:Pyridoxamine 5'-phosphate oxidase
MAAEMPVAELHAGFSSPGANPTDWAQGRRHIEGAEVFWLSTVRPDGRPRVTPRTILGFAKGEQFSQTRWRFASPLGLPATDRSVPGAGR